MMMELFQINKSNKFTLIIKSHLYQLELEIKCQQFGSSQVGECRVRVLQEYGETIKCKFPKSGLLCAAATNLGIDGQGEVVVEKLAKLHHHQGRL